MQKNVVDSVLSKISPRMGATLFKAYLNRLRQAGHRLPFLPFLPCLSRAALLRKTLGAARLCIFLKRNGIDSLKGARKGFLLILIRCS